MYCSASQFLIFLILKVENESKAAFNCLISTSILPSCAALPIHSVKCSSKTIRAPYLMRPGLRQFQDGTFRTRAILLHHCFNTTNISLSDNRLAIRRKDSFAMDMRMSRLSSPMSMICMLVVCIMMLGMFCLLGYSPGFLA